VSNDVGDADELKILIGSCLLVVFERCHYFIFSILFDTTWNVIKMAL